MKEETNIHSQTIINKAWNAVAGRWNYFFKFAFHSKAEYLEFRRRWKENYAALSQSIRAMKAHVKATMRRREYAGKEQAELHVRAAEATMQLEMLKCAKAEACRAARELAEARKRSA